MIRIDMSKVGASLEPSELLDTMSKGLVRPRLGGWVEEMGPHSSRNQPTAVVHRFWEELQVALARGEQDGGKWW